MHRPEFTISPKKRLQDPIMIDGTYQTVSVLIDKDPVRLWDVIHTVGSGVSLVRNAYAKLKMAVAKVDIQRVMRAEELFSKRKLKRKLLKEFSNDILGTSSSKFQLKNRRLLR